MKRNILFLTLLLSSITFSFAQSSSGFIAQMKVGLMGDKSQQNTYSSFDTNHTVKPGLSISIGGAHQYFFKEKMGLRFGMNYEFTQFKRGEQYEYLSAQGQRGGNISRQYTHQSLLAPLQFLWRPKKVTLTAGIIPSLHLKSKLKENHVFFLSGQEIEQNQEILSTGDSFTTPLGDTQDIYLDKLIDFQFVLGFSIQVSPNFLIDIEYKDLIGKNNLIEEIGNFDVVNNFFREYDVFGANISLGLSYLIK